MQEIKVTRCSECPMFKTDLPKTILPEIVGMCVHEFGSIQRLMWIKDNSKMPKDCPIKGETITFKIGDDASTD